MQCSPSSCAQLYTGALCCTLGFFTRRHAQRRPASCPRPLNEWRDRPRSTPEEMTRQSWFGNAQLGSRHHDNVVERARRRAVRKRMHEHVAKGRGVYHPTAASYETPDKRMKEARRRRRRRQHAPIPPCLLYVIGCYM